ncbi:hypothetical protein NLI96_g4482 [Meripilus lineatus]|uniref:BTB domain-containing protein n=1 Tax=Meripilus lineatus TaxID=2056292 RepID=A0AAD5YJV2_9APHY|nr:hypothetical protein NLI96_g4482 [Physisporinus lineatus]
MDPSSALLAPPPFDEENADIVLRSCEGVEFHVYKSILSQASGFFTSMFTLPQPTSSSSSDDGRIPVTEDTRTLDSLLRICYPGPPYNLDNDLSHISNVLEAARKYEMVWALQRAKEALVRFAQNEPVRAYAVACHHNLEVQARECAKLALRIPLETIISTNIEELRSIDGVEFQRLLHYRSKCRNVAAAVAKGWAWSMPTPPLRPFWARENCCPREIRRDVDGNEYYCQPWWFRLMDAVAVELEKSSWDGVLQPSFVFTQFITHHSSVLCTNCRPRAALEIVAFTTRFSERVREAIDQVSKIVGLWILRALLRPSG